MSLIRYAFLSLALTAAPALADSYQASLANPQTARLVIKDAQWSCAGATCAAIRTGSSPDANVCVAVARKLGAVTAFAAGLKPFDAEKLARCNATAGVATTGGAAVSAAR